MLEIIRKNREQRKISWQCCTDPGCICLGQSTRLWSLSQKGQSRSEAGLCPEWKEEEPTHIKCSVAVLEVKRNQELVFSCGARAGSYQMKQAGAEFKTVKIRLFFI